MGSLSKVCIKIVKYFVRISCASISTIRPRKGQCYVLETYKSRINVTSMILIPSFWNLVLLDCYRNKMDAKDKEFYDIVFNNCTEEEIYAILLKKKEIDDKIPKLRTEDETRTLRTLYNKMRKFPKDLIAEMKNKFPSLQRKPKTAEQRKEQNKEYESRKRAAESEIDKEMRLKKQKEYNEKRIAESQIVCNLCNSSNHLCRKCKNTVCNFCGEQDPSSDNEMHIMHKKNVTRCKVAESKIARQRRLNKQKEYDNAKRSAESQEDKEKRLNKQKDYENEKRSTESQEDKEKRLNKQKEYDNAKLSAESVLDKQMRQTKDKATHKKTYRKPTKDWEQELIDKASLTHICTSECRYRPKASMVVVKEKMFTTEEMELLTMNNETLSIDGKYYVCKYCKKFIKKKKIPLL